MPDPTAAPVETPAIPADGAWKTSFGAENVAALESFKTPADFFKSYSESSAELKTLKEKPATFDWRKEVAGEDADLAKLVERFNDPKAFGKGYLEASKKIRSGDLAKPLAADANEQERAAWRQANGIPEKPEGYFEKLPDGLVIGKDDQPLFNEVGAELHKLNASPAIAHALAKWYYGLADKETAAVAETDKVHARETTDALRAKWGNDYRANIGQVMSLLDSLGGELKAQLMDATMPDGRRLFNSPEVVEWFASKAREINPAGILIPASGENSMASLDTEIQGIEKLMGNRSSEYWKGGKAEAMQARYRQLIDAREKIKARAA